ncbi:MAG: thiamine pyrophosphate-binding protein [Bryobacteraceae bacterium]|nr:thiamine pyrophosphate-binding protein [Bryobacteraceae bacterium]
MPSGAELFVESVEKLGITEIFTLVGDHLNEVLSCAWKRGVRLIDMRHESGVTHAADAIARLRRRPALSLVTGGPGHTNSLTGIATAYLAGSPLIAVSGAAPQAPAGRQLFQVVDQVGMAAPVVKWAAQPVSAAQIPYMLGRAYAEATAGRMGPVHLSIPVDVFSERTDAPLPMPMPARYPAFAPASHEVGRALEILMKAERPVVIGGSGVWWADAGEQLQRFLDLTSLPYFSMTLARGIVADHSRENVFGYGDAALNKAVRRAFPEADAILVLGKRIDSRLSLGGARLFSPQAKFIQVDIHPQELGNARSLALGLCGDLKATLAAFVQTLGAKPWAPRKEWIRRLRGFESEWQDELAQAAADPTLPMHPLAFYWAAREFLRGAPLSWDGGECVHWGRALIPAVRPNRWLRLGPLATIGAGLPNAIGMQLFHPNEKVVMITGDGSLGFYIAELDTMVRHKLPVIVVVGNDAAWGVERELQSAGQGTTVACELLPTRYDLVMKGFGGDGETIDNPGQVAPAFKRALDSDKPYLLNVNIRGVRSPFSEWAIGRKK